MNRIATVLVPLLLATAGRLPAQEPPGEDTAAPRPLPRATDVQDLESLIAYVEAREEAVRTVSMRIVTEGFFADGSRFETEGVIRVLGETHFLSRQTARFGGELEAETETVRTPDGMRMRERDPVQGEKFVHMDAETMARVESASRALGDAPASLGAGDGRTQSPLGSAMLRDLAAQFELTVDGPRVVDEQRCWVVAGPAKGAEGDVELLGLGADHVDILVRVADGAVIRMTQLRGGQPLIDVRITELELDRPMEPDEFQLSVVSGEFVDVFEHPPMAAQLERLFAEARAEGWQDPAGGAATDRGR